MPANLADAVDKANAFLAAFEEKFDAVHDASALSRERCAYDDARAEHASLAAVCLAVNTMLEYNQRHLPEHPEMGRKVQRALLFLGARALRESTDNAKAMVRASGAELECCCEDGVSAYDSKCLKCLCRVPYALSRVSRVNEEDDNDYDYDGSDDDDSDYDYESGGSDDDDDSDYDYESDDDDYSDSEGEGEESDLD